MTVVIAFYCSDGIVIAADSMLTPSYGGQAVGHHKGKKIDILPNSLISAYAGDQGQAARFKYLADGLYEKMRGVEGHPISFPIALTTAVINEFRTTGIANVGINTIIAYPYNGSYCCCVFEGALQPRLLDKDHYYVALGSGKQGADPFLRFLVDIFCQDGFPNVREATFLCTWAVQHVINTNPGGVDGPIRISVLEQNEANFSAREITESEIEQHKEAIASIRDNLVDWRKEISGDLDAEATSLPPDAPK